MAGAGRSGITAVRVDTGRPGPAVVLRDRTDEAARWIRSEDGEVLLGEHRQREHPPHAVPCADQGDVVRHRRGPDRANHHDYRRFVIIGRTVASAFRRKIVFRRKALVLAALTYSIAALATVGPASTPLAAYA